jgi:hypothetical protein
MATSCQAQAQREELIKQDVTQIMKTFYCQVRTCEIVVCVVRVRKQSDFSTT